MAGASLCQVRHSPCPLSRAWQAPTVPHLGFLPMRAPHTPKEEKAQGLLGRGRESQEWAQLGECQAPG